MDPPVKFKIEKKPSLYNTKEKVEFVKRAEDKAWSASDYIKQVRVTYSDSTRTILSVNSHGELCEDERLQTLFFVQVVAMKDGVIQAGYEPIGGIIGLELFSQTSPETVAEIASKRAVMMLTAGRINGGAMPVVLASSAGGTMIHEAIGHGLEADLAQQGLSVYSKRLGDMVASPLINVVDDSTMENKRGSFVFDDEGIPSQRTILVENGKLVSYMYDRLTAAKDKKSSTGNGRRQSYKHKPIPRMSNTLILPGTTPPDEIVQSIHKGLLVMKMGGGQVNTVNGDFVFEVAEGYIIENGKVCEPIKGATLTGNGPEILKNIDMVGNDLGFSIGTCGKDDQGVPVADGQPTLRIPSIVVGGKVE